MLEVNQPHPHTRRRRGKSDPIDAELAARHVLAASRLVVAKDTSGIVEAIRQLRVARDGAVKARSAALNALERADRHRSRGSAPTAHGAQDHPRLARRCAHACAPTLDGCASPSRRPRPRCGRSHDASPSSTARSSCSTASSSSSSPRPRRPRPTASRSPPGTPATLLVTAGQNIERLRHEASFAALCGASPIPVSSGRTDRHRLNYGGDRDANRALHMIAVCRLRYCERTRAYADAPHRRRQDQDRDHPLPQALHRARALPRPPRRPAPAARRPDGATRSSPSPAAPDRSDAPSRPLDIESKSVGATSATAARANGSASSRRFSRARIFAFTLRQITWVTMSSGAPASAAARHSSSASRKRPCA